MTLECFGTPSVGYTINANCEVCGLYQECVGKWLSDDKNRNMLRECVCPLSSDCKHMVFDINMNPKCHYDSSAPSARNIE